MTIYRSYFSKNNTIIKDSKLNTARNPVFELVRGSDTYNDGRTIYSRFIFDIDLSQLKEKYDKGEIIPSEGTKHVLKIKNTLSIQPDNIGNNFALQPIKRDSGFELMLFKVPLEWDEGTGNHFVYDKKIPASKLDTDPSNWYMRSHPDKEWEVTGVYDWTSMPEILATQKFPTGDEDIEFDITAEVENRLLGIGSSNDNFIKTEIFDYSGSQDYVLELDVFEITEVTVNGIDQVVNADYTYNNRTVTFITPLEEEDVIRINYIDVSESNNIRPYIFSADHFMYNGSVEFQLRSEPISILAVELNGKDLVHNIDYTVNGDKIILEEDDMDEDYSIVVKYLKKNHGIGGNYGYGIAYTPYFESKDAEKMYGVAFFSKYTNTFFEPYLETKIPDTINDNRHSFHLNKSNRLYFYSIVDGEYKNLDIKPASVKILDHEGEVYKVIPEEDIVHQSKGVYYVELTVKRSEYPDLVMFEDVWEGLVYDGEYEEDYVGEFTLLLPNNRLDTGMQDLSSIGSDLQVSGIWQMEKILKGTRKTIYCNLRRLYGKTKTRQENIEYRIYVRQGNYQIDVIPFTKLNTGNNSYFNMDTSWMIPQRYYLEFRVKHNGSVIKRPETIIFDVIS